MGAESTDPVDFGFLTTQTFGDGDLQHDLLTLFAAQARRVLASLRGLAPKAQGDAAHLLKGSARGIGAWPAARAAAIYESAPPDRRDDAFEPLNRAFAAAIDAIEARLA